MQQRIPQPTTRHWYSRWWFWFMVIVLVIVVGAVSAGKYAYNQYQLKSFDYLTEAVRVEKRDIRKTISTSGTIAPDGVTALRAAAPGTVTAVHTTVGAQVSAGETLMETTAGTIAAPFDGRILTIHAFVGDAATPTLPVIELATRTMHVEFFASDSEVLELATDKNAALSIPAYDNGEHVFTGKVLTISPKKQVSQAVGGSAVAEAGYLVTISTGDIPEIVTAFSGVTVDIEITVAERTQALALVSGAIQYDDADHSFVYLVPTIDDAFVEQAGAREDVTSLLQKKNITIGFQGDEYVEVLEGLSEGERILLYIPSQSGGTL